jgi:hypothetical protein
MVREDSDQDFCGCHMWSSMFQGFDNRQ